MDAVMDKVVTKSISTNGEDTVRIEISGPSAMPDSQNDLKVKAALHLLSSIYFESYMQNDMLKEYVEDVDALKRIVARLDRVS